MLSYYLISETKVQLNLRAASPVTDDSRYTYTTVLKSSFMVGFFQVNII